MPIKPRNSSAPRSKKREKPPHVKLTDANNRRTPVLIHTHKKSHHQMKKKRKTYKESPLLSRETHGTTCIVAAMHTARAVPKTNMSPRTKRASEREDLVIIFTPSRASAAKRATSGGRSRARHFSLSHATPRGHSG